MTAKEISRIMVKSTPIVPVGMILSASNTHFALYDRF